MDLQAELRKMGFRTTWTTSLWGMSMDVALVQFTVLYHYDRIRGYVRGSPQDEGIGRPIEEPELFLEDMKALVALAVEAAIPVAQAEVDKAHAEWIAAGKTSLTKGLLQDARKNLNQLETYLKEHAHA